MAPDSIMPARLPEQAHVRPGAAICATCGQYLPFPKPRQRFCSGKCRAAASRQARSSRMLADLRELQRRLDVLVREMARK